MAKRSIKYLYALSAFLIPLCAYAILNPPSEWFRSESAQYAFTAALTLNAFILICLLWMGRGAIKKNIKIDRKSAVVLFLIFSVALYVRTYVVPHASRILFDEDIYMQIATTMTESGKTQFCTKWVEKECFDSHIDKHPNALPHTLAFFYLFSRSRVETAHAMIVIIGSLSIFLVYLLSVLLFEKKEIGYFSALLLALYPVHIIWSGSVSSEIYHVFLSLLTFTLAIIYLKTREKTILLSSATSLAYAVQTRPESALFIAVAGLTILLLSTPKKVWNLVDDLLIYFVVFLLFSTLHLSFTNHVRKVDTWGAKEETFSINYFEKNIRDLYEFMINPQKNILLLLPLFFISLVPTGKTIRYRAILFLWFLLFFAIYLFFYAGSVKFGGTSFRFIIMWIAPVLIMSSYSISRINDFLSRYVNYASLHVFWTALIIIAFLPTIEFIANVDRQADSARLMQRFGIDMSSQISDECIVITSTPAIFIVQGQNTMDIKFASRRESLNQVMQTRDCVYFYWDYWCRFAKTKQCTNVLNSNNHTLVASVSGDHGWIFEFHQLHERF
jgi:hypothetical protein